MQLNTRTLVVQRDRGSIEAKKKRRAHIASKMIMRKFSTSSPGPCRGSSLALFLLISILQALLIPLHIRCQDFEDLKPNNLNGAPRSPAASNLGASFQQQQQQVFQSSRQSQSATSAPFANQNEQQGVAPSSANSRQAFQRPMLSSRFAPQQQQLSQLSAQASTGSATVASLGQPVAAASAIGSAPASSSNIENIMKNALARSAKLEGAETRQEAQANAQPPADQAAGSLQSRSGAQFQPSQAAPAASALPITTAAIVRDRQGEPSEPAASNQPAEEVPDKQALANHETVYTDQRFASLFARRGAGKKAKFTPTEQVRAKPTLPSFIKSLPDPKQFAANPSELQERPITQASSSLISARIQQQQQQQQQQQNRNSQKKTPVVAITSNSAATANSKRLQAAQKPGANAAAGAAKPNGSGAKPAAQVTSKPATSNNPFSKSQANNSDPANVIAMARRRLLANNAALQQKQQSA